MSTPLRPAERACTLSTRQGWNEFVSAPPRQRPETLSQAQIRALAEQARLEYEERRPVWHANLGPLRTPQMRAVHEHLDHRIREAGTQVRSVQRDFYPERAGCHASEPPAAAPYGEPGT